MKLRLVSWLLLVELVAIRAKVGGAQQTVFFGTNNWNLISFWVQPTNPAPEAVFADLIRQGRLISAFAYEYDGATQGAWKRFYPNLSSDKAWLNTLNQVRACQGYWVDLTPGQPPSLTVTGTPTAIQSNTLRTGWNLVGLGNDRRLFWADGFGSMAGGLQALFGFDAANRTFIGFNQPQFGPADVNGNGQIETSEYGWTYQNDAGVLRYIEPGQALWVKVPSDMDITPLLEVEVESDVDPFPPGASTNTWFQPGIDTDMNGNGLLDYGFGMAGQYDQYGHEYLNTQDTIWFRVPTGGAHSNLVILRQQITLLNNGAGGVLQFEVDADLPWVALSPTNGSVLAGPGGRVVDLQVDMAGLPTGEYRGTLRVRSNGGSKSYVLKLTVPELDGLYSGEITVTNLQGQLTYPLTWPVQMQLNLRGVSLLQAAGSPNFPIDIALVNSDSVSNFNLSGSVALNVGDAGNPFGVPAQRSLNFRGGRIALSPGQTVGMNLGLMGQYQEILTGLPSGPVLLQGYFTLNAKTNKRALEEP